MGFWKSARGINGDSWADKMDGLMHSLAENKVFGSKTYGDTEHEITMEEFADLVEFCSRGHLKVDVRFPEDAQRPLSQLHADESVQTYENRGQVQELANV